ncbi:hypothetical protein HOL59_05605 [Candidatus Woesearchaeota archaeon]|jgi:hypothetical protein|nr:hypothetical protein [Candidatus Woesearchaeota archaeon]
MEMDKVGELLRSNGVNEFRYVLVERLATIEDANVVESVIKKGVEVFQKRKYVGEHLLLCSPDILVPCGLEGYLTTADECKELSKYSGPWGHHYGPEMGSHEPGTMLAEKSPKILENFGIEGMQQVSELAKRTGKMAGHGDRLCESTNSIIKFAAELEVTDGNRDSLLGRLTLKVDNMLNAWSEMKSICYGCNSDYWKHSGTFYTSCKN